MGAMVAESYLTFSKLNLCLIFLILMTYNKGISFISLSRQEHKRQVSKAGRRET